MAAAAPMPKSERLPNAYTALIEKSACALDLFGRRRALMVLYRPKTFTCSSQYSYALVCTLHPRSHES